MTDIASFSARLDLDEAVVRRMLESESSAAGRSMPWYVLLLLGLGAWITALIMIVFVAVFLDFVVGLDEPGLGSAAIGVAMFLCGLLIEAKIRESAFAEQFAIALVAAGAAIAAASVGFEYESFWTAAAAATALTAIDIWRGRNAQQQFLLAALAVGLAIAALSDAMVAGRVDIVALALPVGALLYLRPAAEGRAADRDGAAAGHAVLCRRGGHAVRPDLWLRRLAGARHRDGHDPAAGLAARHGVARHRGRHSAICSSRSSQPPSASSCRPADRRRWRS